MLHGYDLFVLLHNTFFLPCFSLWFIHKIQYPTADLVQHHFLGSPGVFTGDVTKHIFI